MSNLKKSFFMGTAAAGAALLVSAFFSIIAVNAACTNPSPLPTGFAAPCPVFSLSSTSVTQSQTLTLSATPQAGTDYIYTTAYVSQGTAWNPYTLSGNNAYPSYSSTLASLTLSSAQLSTLSLGTHYAVSWDWLWDATANCYKGPGLNQCNTGQWRVQSFNLTSSYAYSQSSYYAYSQSSYYAYSQSAYTGGSTPFTGTPYPIPGTIQAENYDKGGQSVAYYDTTPGNAGGAYRTDDVDIEATTDTGGGYDVGYTAAGEWLNYTVNVGTAGTYTLSARVASSGQGGTFHFALDGANLGTTFTIPNTGGWQAWTTLSQSVSLTAGTHILKLVEDTAGSTGYVGNFNWVQFTSGSYTYSQSSYYVYSQSSYYAYSQSSYTSYTYSQAAYTGGQPWTGILDPSRAIDWSKAGIPGGIPSRTTINTTINASACNNGSTDCTATIQSALNNAPVNTVVALGAGTFRLNGVLNIPNGRVLRGQGANQTILDVHSTSGSGGSAYSAAITMGYGCCVSTSQDVSITGGATKGSTSITVSNTANIAVGKYLQISELNDSSLGVSDVGDEGACTWCDLYGGARVVGQVSEVAAVSGNTVTISPGLFRNMSLTPLATPFTMDKYTGLENLQVYANNTTAGADITLAQCAYCWVSGVEVNYADGDWLDVTFGYRDAIVNNYFSNAFLHVSGTWDSDINLRSKTTASLVQNNIMERGHVGTMLDWGSAGNVIAYNYEFNNFDTNAYNHLQGSYGSHGAHPEFNLSEGNIDDNYSPDTTHGSNSDDTSFRDWHRGISKGCNPAFGRGTVTCSPMGVHGASGVNGWWQFQQIQAYNLAAQSLRFNLVGAVLGSQDMKNLKVDDGSTPEPNVKEIVAVCGTGITGVYTCGANSRVYDGTSYDVALGYCASSTGGGACSLDSNQPYYTWFEHGVYASADGSTAWASGVTQTLPASFYLSSKPAWWGSLSWPGIGPDITGGLANAFGHAYNNPAKNCYENVMGGTDGTGSPLNFNAASCYP